VPRTAVPARALRGAVVASVGLGVAVAGHVHAGGTLTVGPLGVLVALVVVGACVLVSRTQWGVARLLAALAGMQVAVHACLWFESGSHEADTRLAGLLDATGTHAHAHAGGALSARMLLAHLVAVVVAAVLLAGLDAAVVVIGALARRLRPVVVVPVPATAPARATRATPSLPAWALARSSVVRRGPPALLAPC
jgi:hypothetical protein